MKSSTLKLVVDNKDKKIHLNQNLIWFSKNHWRYKIYYYHDFLHPKYNDYVATDDQVDKGTFFNDKY